MGTMMELPCKDLKDQTINVHVQDGHEGSASGWGETGVKPYGTGRGRC